MDAQRMEMLLAKAKKLAELNKATFSVPTGLVNYDLTPRAYQMYPVPTPLRNSITRKKGNGGNAVNWKQITAVNVTNLSIGVGEGHRSGEIQASVASKLSAYAVIGLDASVTFEAEEASEGYDDAQARATESLLNSVMIGEEKAILWGNSSTALAAPAAPTVSAAGTGATLPAATYLVYCVALTLEGFNNASVANGVPLSVTRTNLDGTSDTYNGGSSALSPASSGQAVTLGQTLTASVVAVKGAAAYAWFVGTSLSTAALAAITNINTVAIAAAPAGTQTANLITTDHSTNGLVFDGLIPQIVNAGTGYIKSLDGAALTADAAGGINEIDVALQAMYDNYRLGPDEIWVSSTEQRNIKKKVLGNGGSPLVRFTMDGGQGASHNIAAGAVVGSYLNPFMGTLIPIKVHPFLPQGTILGPCRKLPYNVSNVPDEAFFIRARRDYYGIAWPVTTRRYDHGVYSSQTLQYIAPFAAMLIQNVLNG